MTQSAFDEQGNRSSVTLHLYAIENPPWFQLTPSQVESISEQIRTGGWQSVNDRRRGFLNCTTADNLVYGYFAQEGLLRVEQYNDQQERVAADQLSFEKVFFLFFLNEGIIAIQSRRISGYVDLKGPDIRDSLFDALEIVFRRARMQFRGRAQFDPYRQEYTKEELIRIFETHSVVRIQVTDLKNQKVPADLKLFNPNFDADEFLKTVINTDLIRSQQVEWTGDDVQQTKIARGLIYTGTPKLIEGYDEDGEMREWQKTMPESIALELNTSLVHFPEEDLQRVLSLIRRKVGVFTRRLDTLRQQRDDEAGELPLFNEAPE